jgi:hypothetical protein
MALRPTTTVRDNSRSASVVSPTSNSQTSTPPPDPFALQILLEDYKLWLRELEKQDRWLYQGVWTVLAASAGALYLVHTSEQQIRLPAAIAIGVVAIAFIILNGDFLATRVSSYRMVSRRVAAGPLECISRKRQKTSTNWMHCYSRSASPYTLGATTHRGLNVSRLGRNVEG